jgi:type II secretory ATPase GspE/PulE/Tfp pilus assembly ATPase PilB-like protein
VQGAVISRIKNMAHIDIADKNTPQHGRIRIRMAKQTFDLRISILPTSRGEKVVIRLLYPKSSPATVEQLGFEEKDALSFISWVSRPQGMVLVAGPAGSGTTTTLYAALRQRSSITQNITTIEDPIEYELDGTYQVEVNENAGRTFTRTIPAILHQDPDVMMVGELRDLETATLAIQAAFTGRMVLSALRTKSSVPTITWLKNLGIPAHFIASAVNGILAQRLVRVICPHCKSPDTPAEEDLWRIGLTKQQAAQLTFYRGTGCEKCGQTGYLGRIGIYELLTMSPRLKQFVRRRRHRGNREAGRDGRGLHDAHARRDREGLRRGDQRCRTDPRHADGRALRSHVPAVQPAHRSRVHRLPTLRAAAPSDVRYLPRNRGSRVAVLSLLRIADCRGYEPRGRQAGEGKLTARSCSATGG